MRRGSPVTWEQVRVGLLLLVAMAVLSSAVFLIGNTGNVFGTRYRLVMLVRSAAGIVPGQRNMIGVRIPNSLGLRLDLGA